jgi:CARDB
VPPRVLSVSLTILVAILGTLVTAFPAGADPFFATLQGPTAVAPGQVASYNATVSGTPTGAVLDYSWYLSGANTTGGSPLKNTPGTLEGNRTTLRFNVTAPQAEGTFTIHLSVGTKAQTGIPQENATADLTVTVIRAIVLAATFHNSAPTKAVNVTVRFYVDDSFVGSSVMKQIGPNSDASATFNYLPVGLAPGSHTVRVEADLLGSPISTYTLFYKDVTPPSTSLSVLVAIGVFFPVFIVTVGLRRRRR